jgi:single-strand DNA-binding protein
MSKKKRRYWEIHFMGKRIPINFTKSLLINLFSEKNRLDTTFFAVLQQGLNGDMMKPSKGEEMKFLINQVTIVGRLTKDPELKMTTEGTPVTQVTLAVSRHYRNHNGEIESDFIPCTLWRKTAENTAHYCRKGSVVGVTGKLQTRHYDNREGKRVYVTEVVAETIRFLSAKPHEVETVEVKKEELPF